MGNPTITLNQPLPAGTYELIPPPATGNPGTDQPTQQPPVASGDYPSGDALLTILASINWAFGDSAAAQTGQVGSPVHDGIALCNGDVTQWDRYVNATADANVLVPVAKWLRAGWTLDQMNQALAGEGRSIEAGQVDALSQVMRRYNLLQ